MIKRYFEMWFSRCSWTAQPYIYKSYVAALEAAYRAGYARGQKVTQRDYE